MNFDTIENGCPMWFLTYQYYVGLIYISSNQRDISRLEEGFRDFGGIAIVGSASSCHISGSEINSYSWQKLQFAFVFFPFLFQKNTLSFQCILFKSGMH